MNEDLATIIHGTRTERRRKFEEVAKDFSSFQKYLNLLDPRQKQNHFVKVVDDYYQGTFRKGKPSPRELAKRLFGRNTPKFNKFRYQAREQIEVITGFLGAYLPGQPNIDVPQNILETVNKLFDRYARKKDPDKTETEEQPEYPLNLFPKRQRSRGHFSGATSVGMMGSRPC